MDAIAVPAMLGLSLVGFVVSAYSVITWTLSKKEGSNPRNHYRWMISTGLTFVLLAANGAIAVGYLAEDRTLTTVTVILFLVFGLWLIQRGFKVKDVVLAALKDQG